MWHEGQRLPFHHEHPTDQSGCLGTGQVCHQTHSDPVDLDPCAHGARPAVHVRCQLSHPATRSHDQQSPWPACQTQRFQLGRQK